MASNKDFLDCDKVVMNGKLVDNPAGRSLPSANTLFKNAKVHGGTGSGYPSSHRVAPAGPTGRSKKI